MSHSVLDIYLEKHFPDLVLESPLFYNAPIGIRFELGIPRGIEDPNYFTDIKMRAVMLFQEVFEADSNIMVVVNSYRSATPYYCLNQGEDVFPKYIKDKRALDRVDCIRTEKNYEDNGDLTGVSYRHLLPCKRVDIDYKGMLEAKSHMDFAIQPYISDSVFFINTDKHIIYYMYDDRGLDLVSEEKKSLVDIYEKYNEWILDYDRVKIDHVFKI